MKNQISLLLIFIALSLSSYSQEYTRMIRKGTYTVAEIKKSADKYFETTGKGKGTGYKQYKRWEYDALRMKDRDGYLKNESFYYNELLRFNAENNKKKKNQSISLNDNWEELGPYDWNIDQSQSWIPGVGRVTAIAVDKNDSNKIIVGAERGGVWRTIDNGENWTCLTDNITNLSVFSLTIDPSNSSVFYWGSTEGIIYKSTDTGATWDTLSHVHNYNFSSETFGVRKILIHPNNPDTIFVCSSYAGGYKSIDGGNTWTQVGGRIYDVEFKPGNPNIVYFSGNRFYKSIDGGGTFVEKNISPVTDPILRIIGVSPANPEVIYISEAYNRGFHALYKSTDAGETFTQIPTSQNFYGYNLDGNDQNTGQAPRNMTIAVSPTDINEIHIGGVNTWKSNDGGLSFNISSYWVVQQAAGNNVGYCHADINFMEFIGNKLYLGTDGGIFSCENTGTINENYYTDLSSGLGIRHFYKIGVSQTNPVIVGGGAQDNGTSLLNASGQWIDWLGADGMETFVDKTNPNTIYGEAQNGYLFKSTDGGASYANINFSQGYGLWVTPFEQDPVDENTIYSAYHEMFKSIDGGDNWTSISQAFNNETYIQNFKIAHYNNNVMFFNIQDGGKLYKTSTGSGTWSPIYDFETPIINFAIHPTDPNRLAVAVNTSYWGGMGEKVYVSTDGGSSWNSYTFNLPDFSPLCLVWQNNDANGLYLGMNYGIYYIDDNFTEWQTFSNNLPNVKINELEINYAENKIYAATYGRGLWSSPLYDSETSVENINKLNSLSVYPNPVNDIINISWDEDYKSEVRLFDIKGKIVYYSANADLSATHSFDISKLRSGIYFLKVSTKKGIVTKKIIKINSK